VRLMPDLKVQPIDRLALSLMGLNDLCHLSQSKVAVG
jgi:hypothetical protein